MVCAGAFPAYAIDDPALEFFTITTPHFYVHYNSELEPLAQKVAHLSEQAHEVLVPILDWSPKQRTHVVVVDKADTANGFASVHGRNMITIYGMPPEADSVLGHYDDWLRILVFHEYVHILHLDTTPGIPAIINRIIGKQYHPNQILPRWYIEGIATYQESAQTGTGRVNHSLFKMWLRTAALEDAFFSLGKATGFPQHWPGGSAAYLYGAFFVDFITRQYGDSFVRDFNHAYSTIVIPFFMNLTSRYISGRTFDSLWEEWTSEVHGWANAQRVAVRSLGETTLEYITTEGGRHAFPRIRPNTNQVSFYHAGFSSQSSFALYDPGARKVLPLKDVRGASGATSWSPDGQTILYSRAMISQNVYTYQDLFSWHAPSGQTRRLTHAERAREPSVSPDGTKVAYVRNRHGTMELVIRAIAPNFLALGEEHIVVSGYDWASDDPRFWQQISMPQWTADGNALVFSWWHAGEQRRNLWQYRLDVEHDEQALQPLTQTSFHEMDPHIGHDGLLYFAADYNGIFNIYARDFGTGDIWQISNVVNGVFSPALSKDGHWIYVRAYTSKGYEIARFRKPGRFYYLANPNPYPNPSSHSYGSSNQSERAALTPFPSRPYQAWRWLTPLTFTPDAVVATGGVGVSATVEGNDPIGHHNYAISGGWTQGDENYPGNQANLGFQYRYRGLPVGLGLLARIQNTPRFGGYVAESRNVPFMERQYLSRLALTYPFRAVGESFSMSTSYSVDYTRFLTTPEVDHDPADVLPRLPEHGWFNQLSFDISYNQLERYAHSISTERGFGATMGLSVQNPALGSDYNAITVNYGLDAFYPNPWIDHHVVSLQQRGGAAFSNFRAQRLFSLGGFTSQDVLESIIFQDPFRGLVLRGYPPAIMRGRQYHLSKVEYRFPLLTLDSGFSTVPVFFQRLKGALFVDTGAAFDDYWSDASYRTGVGVELQLDAVLAYGVPNSLRFGFARGLHEEGIAEWYLLFGSGF